MTSYCIDPFGEESVMANTIGIVGIIGLGRMGRCMVKGLLQTQTLKKTEVFFTTKHPETADLVEKELGIKACSI
ncbi:MAG: hypothetical protein EBV23_13640, partial [Flavobacteriia bacterium]|nr:hypothetical protein [Flavobacteriia bacterium]